MSAQNREVNQTEEEFDILNEDGTFRGFSKARSLVHRDGDWHRSTHVWVFTRDGKVLVQLRSAQKDTFPVSSVLPYLLVWRKYHSA